MEGQNPAWPERLARFYVLLGWSAMVMGLLGVVVGAVELAKSLRQDVVTAEVVALEPVDGSSSWARARLRIALPDGRVVTPLTDKHYSKLQPGNRVEVRFDPDDPEAPIRYDSTGPWGEVSTMVFGVGFIVAGRYQVRIQLAERRALLAARRRDE